MSGRTLASRAAGGRASPDGRLLWLAPVVVAVVVATLSDKRIEYVLAAGIGLPLLVWIAGRPDRAVIALAVFLPLETVGFGFLLGFHVPGAVLRPAGALKELIALALLLAAVREIRARRRHLDAVDLWGLGYVAVVTVYLLVPHLLSSLDDTFSVRLLAWRTDCGYVLVFLAVRHVPLTSSCRRRFGAAVLGVGALAVAAGLIQAGAPSTFSRVLLDQGRALQFQTGVLHNPATVAAGAVAYLENLHPLRVSSIFESPFDLGDYLLVVFALVIARITRVERSRWQYLLLAAVVAVLFFTRVRADALAAVVLIGAALLPAAKKPAGARVRLLALVLVGVVVIAPSLAGTRFVGAQGGAASDTGHLQEVSTGVRVLFDHPLGVGLGANPATANRFLLSSADQGATTTDNSVTQVGDELGFEGLIPWTVFVAAVLLALRRRARRGDPFAAAGGLALVGVLIAGQYHHVFLNYDVAWTLWAMAGLALNLTPAQTNAPAPQPFAPPHHLSRRLDRKGPWNSAAI